MMKGWGRWGGLVLLSLAIAIQFRELFIVPISSINDLFPGVLKAT
jgi:hypothetical protein